MAQDTLKMMAEFYVEFIGIMMKKKNIEKLLS